MESGERGLKRPHVPVSPASERPHSCTVHLGSGGDIDGMLARVTEAGGKVLQGKQLMGETIGWLAYVEDTEGNHIGIQQQA